MHEEFPDYFPKQRDESKLAPRSITYRVSYRRILNDGPLGRSVMKSMIFFNDFTSAGFLNDLANDSNVLTSKHRRMADFWTLRMTILTLSECVKFLGHLRNLPEAKPFLDDKRLRKNFSEVERWLPGGTDVKEFNRLVKSVRDTISGHIDHGSLEKAMEFRASTPRLETGKVEYHTTHDWATRFFCADAVAETVVWHNAWGINGQQENLDEQIQKDHKEMIKMRAAIAQFVGHYASLVTHSRGYFK